jgi:hypothetical protein
MATNPQAACHRWLTALGGGAVPSAENAARVERIIEALEKHGAEELIAAAELLEKTSAAQDRAAALEVAKTEVDKLPRNAAAKLRG